MNKEDFISYETAVKLKELGFDWKCAGYYYIPEKRFSNVYPMQNYNEALNFLSAPSLWEAQKWLRVVHGIHIAVIGTYDCVGNLYAFEVWLQEVSAGRLMLLYETKKLSDYESALSAGIEAALKLIEEGEV